MPDLQPPPPGAFVVAFVVVCEVALVVTCVAALVVAFVVVCVMSLVVTCVAALVVALVVGG